MKPLTEVHLAILRRHMVEVIEIEYDLTSQETGLDVINSRLRDALLRIPRHRFVPDPLASMAYNDQPLPIGFEKTISQPFMSALMIDLLDLRPGDRVLEVGTGLGYQTALLSSLAAKVWSVDVVEEFAVTAADRLGTLGLGNITLRVGDGSRGWSDEAPFDAILVSAAARDFPDALIGQLAPSGRMVLPLRRSDGRQHLARIVRSGEDEVTVDEIMAVQFTDLETVI
ncbi:MAG TPA: protein-L-isoaspartate(D-aspartate) O-methyltransferase [Sphingomonas sp.]